MDNDLEESDLKAALKIIGFVCALLAALALTIMLLIKFAIWFFN